MDLNKAKLCSRIDIVILPFKNKKPILGEKVFIADGAVLICDIEIQESTGKIFLLTDSGSIWRMHK